MRMSVSPTMFLITGFFWAMASSVLGLTLYLAMIFGYPTPPYLRLVHVHGALAGGVAQMILGAMLTFIPPLLMTGRDRADSHPLLFGTINGGAIILLVGFVWRNSAMIGVGGVMILFAFLSLLGDAVRQARSSLVSPPLNLWFYGVALIALLAGLGMEEALVWGGFSQTTMAQGRLAHIHLNLLGFVTLTIVGTMHNFFPTVLNAGLHSVGLTRIVFVVLPAGIVTLVAGFFLGQVWVTLTAGGLFLAGTVLYGYNVLRTWLAAGKPRHAASDHLLLATFFLTIAVVAGLLVTVNSLEFPPKVPFGHLHLVAYTHLALIGFMFQTIAGALSHLLPISLALRRVASNKKRGPYLAALMDIVEWQRSFQVTALSLGTMGLMLVAALVWQLNLQSTPVRLAGCVSAGLLIVSLILLTAKVIRLLIYRPMEAAHTDRSASTNATNAD